MLLRHKRGYKKRRHQRQWIFCELLYERAPPPLAYELVDLTQLERRFAQIPFRIKRINRLQGVKQLKRHVADERRFLKPRYFFIHFTALFPN